MSTLQVNAHPTSANESERITWFRYLWVAPLTVVAVLAVNTGVKLLIQAFIPSLAAMSQLQRPLISISFEGATAAVLVFGLLGLVVERPIYWYRRLAVIALLISFLPDVGLGFGGEARALVGRVMAVPLSLGAPAPSGGGGGPPPGLPPPVPVEQVLVLFLLHTITACVCVLMLTTLTRSHSSSPEVSP